MTRVTLVLTCFVIFVQFYGILSEKYCTGSEISKSHRVKRSHATPVSDHTLNPTNNNKQGKLDSEQSKIDVSSRKRETITKRKPKVTKVKPKQADSKIINIRNVETTTTPKTLLHFIEDIDEETPIRHNQVKKPTLKEDLVKSPSKNETLEVTKPTKKDKIESIANNLVKRNITKETPDDLIPQLETAVPENTTKAANKSSDLIEPCTNKSANTTKEKGRDESIASLHKSTKDELDDQKHAPENSVIEIKEHKYEEDIMRFYPTKPCQPNAKGHWDSSQNFDPRFSSSYLPAMNVYQGLTQADPYHRDTYNKDRHYSPYTCANYMDQNNGQFFYANFDDPNKQAEENRRFQRYSNYNRMRKTWLDRNIRIRKPGSSDEYVESNTKNHIL